MNPPIPPGGQEEIAAYYAAITAIDDQVGRLMRTLNDLQLDENTIVLFTSDHGDMLGSHGLRRKRKPHDESSRVPGIIRWPGKIPAGLTVDTLLNHVDMPSTLLGLAGVGIPNEMQGADLSKVAMGKTTTGPEAVLLQIFVPYRPNQIERPWRGIVTQSHSYARFADEPWLLFDRTNDPHELRNLIGGSGTEELQRRLEDQLSDLMKKNGDSWNFNSMELVEEGGRLYRHETFYSLEEYREWAKEHPELVK